MVLVAYGILNTCDQSELISLISFLAIAQSGLFYDFKLRAHVS